MPGDISRDTAPRARREGYRQVLMQQGRVQLDADWNEQAALAADRDRAAARDAVGPCGVPVATPDAFRIGDLGADGPADFAIGDGRLYLDGLLVDTAGAHRYRAQPFDADPAPADPVVADGGVGLVFLAVFEREVTALEDDRLREPALGGPDTATRVQTVWRVGIMPLADTGFTEQEVLDTARAGLPLDVPAWRPLADVGGLQVRVTPEAVDPGDRSCLLDPATGFLGVENQLYRVQVRRGGRVGAPGEPPPTFTWSRDNASVVVPVSAGPDGLVLETDPRVGEDDFPTGGWAELLDRDQELAREPGHLAQVRRPPGGRGVVLDPAPPQEVTGLVNPRLRRWDQQGAAATADGVTVTGGFDDLEAGIQVRFAPGTYRPGDYWLIPARTATGDVEWPPDGPESGPDAVVPPRGADARFGPLALVRRGRTDDLRVLFRPLVTLAPEQPTVLETSTLAPVLQPLDRGDPDEEATGWGHGIGVAFTRSGGDGFRRVDGVTAALLPPRSRVVSLRVVGAGGTDRGELEVGLLRLGFAPDAGGRPHAETVVAVRLPLAAGPFDETVTLATPHPVDGDGSRYVLRALATRPPRTGSFVADDVVLHAFQITYLRG
jgi:Family of unknown function (DUF6519)